MANSKPWSGWGSIIGALVTAIVTIGIFWYQQDQTFPYTIQIHNQITQETMNEVTVVIEVEGEKFMGTTDKNGVVTVKIGKKFKDKYGQLQVKDEDDYVQFQKDIQLKALEGEEEQAPQNLSIPPFKRFVVPPVSAQLAQDTHKDTPFSGIENVPILIEIRSFGELVCRVEVINTDEEILWESGNIRANNQFKSYPFTPPENGNYAVRIQGKRNVGSYLLHISFIDEESQPPNEVIPLADNADRYQNRLGAEAYDDYTFEGVSNTPIILQTRTESQLIYRVLVLNKDKEVLWESGNNRQSTTFNEYPFTPLEDAIYTLRILGVRNFGDYWVKYHALDKPRLIEVQIEERYENSLAEGAYDDYQLEGVTNIPLMIKAMGKDQLGYRVEVLDVAGSVLKQSGNLRQNTQFDELLFTPPLDGAYTIRVNGIRNFGDYVLIVENVYDM